VDRQYDLFEKFPDGKLMWKSMVVGRENAIHELQKLATTTANECCLMHLPTKTVIASMNIPDGNDLKKQT
jgi:hypothetical protein